MVLGQRAKHKLAVFGLVGLKQVGIHMLRQWQEKEEDKKIEKQKREVTVKKVTSFSVF